MELHFKTNSAKHDEPKQNVELNDFPSLDVLLSILQDEHASEIARTDRIDNKSIALLTLVIALITVYVPIIPFDALPNIFKSGNCHLIMVTSLFLLLGILALFLTINCVIKIVEIYKPTQYQGINFEALNSDDWLGVSPLAKYQFAVIDHFQDVILSNASINSQKALTLSQQIKKIIIIFGLLSVSSIGLLICSGF